MGARAYANSTRQAGGEMGERLSPRRRVACFLLSTHINFWTPLRDEKSNDLKFEKRHHDLENVSFLLILISNPKTVEKRGKTSCIKILIY